MPESRNPEHGDQDPKSREQPAEGSETPDSRPDQGLRDRAIDRQCRPSDTTHESEAPPSEELVQHAGPEGQPPDHQDFDEDLLRRAAEQTGGDPKQIEEVVRRIEEDGDAATAELATEARDQIWVEYQRRIDELEAAKAALEAAREGEINRVAANIQIEATTETERKVTRFREIVHERWGPEPPASS